MYSLDKKRAGIENHPFRGSGLYTSRVEAQRMFRFGNVGQTATGQDDCRPPPQKHSHTKRD